MNLAKTHWNPTFPSLFKGNKRYPIGSMYGIFVGINIPYMDAMDILTVENENLHFSRFSGPKEGNNSALIK